MNYNLIRIKKSSEELCQKVFDDYYEIMNPEVTTERDAIHYWIDNYNEKFEDKFHPMVLLLNNEVIGYAQLTFFKENKNCIIDYVFICPEFRNINTFIVLFDLLKEYIINNEIEIERVITELTYVENKINKTDNTKVFKRMLLRFGFEDVNVDYYQLAMGEEDEKKKADLLVVFLTNKKKKDIENLLFDIYLRHYYRWFEYYGVNLNNYKKIANESLLESIKSIK